MNDTRTDLPNGDFKFTEIKLHPRAPSIDTAQLDKDLNDFDMRHDITEFPNNRVIINVEQMHRFWTYANTLKNIRKTTMIEKFEECPKCSAHGKDWNYDGQICALCEKQKEQNQHPLKPLSLTLPPVDLYALVKEVCNEIVGGRPDCYAPTSSIHLQATRVKEAVEYLNARGLIAAKPEPVNCQSCDGTGKIELHPDSIETHPCEDCCPDLFKIWKDGQNSIAKPEPIEGHILVPVSFFNGRLCFNCGMPYEKHAACTFCGCGSPHIKQNNPPADIEPSGTAIAIPEGYVLMPIEPTLKIRGIIENLMYACGLNYKLPDLENKFYKAMLSARPKIGGSDDR